MKSKYKDETAMTRQETPPQQRTKQKAIRMKKTNTNTPRNEK